MMKRSNFVAALLAATFSTAGVAFAADQAMQPPANQSAATKDAGKLSADGVRGYDDVAMARLAIFDGRISDAKKYVEDADSAFNAAKTDDSVFLKAEADLKSPDTANGGPNADAKSGATAGADKSASTDQANAAKQPTSAGANDTKTVKSWLPVDAEMSVNEDLTANSKKAAAVADANKSLAAGDKQGAMSKLKLADVNIDYVMAVVPLKQAAGDVHQAAQLVDNGKYYQASQLLRQVQDSTRYDLLDVNAVPVDKQGKRAAQPAPATH